MQRLYHKMRPNRYGGCYILRRLKATVLVWQASWLMKTDILAH